MRRFFYRHLKTSAGNDGKEQESRPTKASLANAHVCTPLCEGIASLPREYHESAIAQLTQVLGATPDKLMLDGIPMRNDGIVSGESRRAVPELHKRRDPKGSRNLTRMPLALPTTYRYCPLPKGHARFLRLSSLGSYPLAYLESHSLENPPSYIAISYCWNLSSPRKSIFLDLQNFSIPETVLEVLNQVQATQSATGSKDLLWIDQICINQDDHNEKLDQMYRMGEIYHKADKVFIWLGPTAHQSDLALTDLEKMLGRVAALNQATATREDMPDGAAQAINEEHGQLYGHLFMRPWFRRLWTAQEALLARKLVVMCGCREVEFGLLAELATQILTYGSLDVIHVPGVSEHEMTNALVGVVNLQTLRRKGPSVSRLLRLNVPKFNDFLLETRSRQCTVPSDRVHALMGVAPLQIRESMARIQSARPKQCVWHLYAEFAKCLLDNDPEWHFLSSAPSRTKPIELPSWVPNFNSPPPFASQLGNFSAGISPATRHLIYRTVTTEELTARGFRLDTIAEIVPQTAFTEATQNTRHNDVYGDGAAREWEQACLRLCQKVHGLGPEQLPRLHVDVLLAQSAAAGEEEAAAPVEAYHVFWTGCRLRDEALRQIRDGEFPLPEHLAHLPDAAERLADRAVKAWRNKLAAEEYALLLQFTATMKAVCSGRPYISTKKGLLGLGCPGAQVGDVVCVLYGTTVPYVLRPRSDGAMSFVGDAYIHGAMDGEAITSPERERDEMIRIC
ncbi:heterokaryon incompatibility protein-domain-containing protein [Corynascus novoguineensis]|uniref:Heterokaryon incompatibility protein-domain-containing protein n=1 Tax=Corynascus novoguineensis TaxID=1126955 RepID=A0AAN7HRU5_9PEZI|nr:heterokaryon incompatibility protein-domain-containing protein [Corynascus novoguineensis]